MRRQMFDKTPPSRPAIEILGPWLMNKGDELMLRSVLERLGNRFEIGASTDLKMDGQMDIPILLRVKWQPDAAEFRNVVRRRAWRECLPIIKRAMALPVMPQRVLRSRGLINGRELTGLLDCSGFAYGDYWTPRRLVNRTKYYERLRQQGVKLVMLPQALGPFEDLEVRRHARRMFDQFDMILPREAVSEQHVLKLGVDPAKVSSCPDISHLLAGRSPPQPAEWARRVAIVPNARMLDKTDPIVAERYLDFLVLCVERVIANGLEPCVLLHEANDDVLLQRLLCRLKMQPPVFREDGVTTKGFLGCCYANIGSRYHALVSSLSQATPSLGTSWAHKYEALFSEYQCTDCLVSPALDTGVLAQRIDTFLQRHRHDELRALLRRNALSQMEKVERMWSQVESIIS